jgi:hypothetical protein
LRASYNYYSDNEDHSEYTNMAKSFVHTLGGALGETPLASTPQQAIEGLQGVKPAFWYNQIKSTLEPGLLQEISDWQDHEDGWFSGRQIKRKPAGLGETLESGVPYLRENLDEK